MDSLIILPGIIPSDLPQHECHDRSIYIRDLVATWEPIALHGGPTAKLKNGRCRRITAQIVRAGEAVNESTKLLLAGLPNSEHYVLYYIYADISVDPTLENHAF